jgi:DNA polymerase epsilon subunit 2
MTYEGCHVFNPGRFIGRSLGFSTYTPATRESEAWYISLFPDNCGGHSLHFPSIVDLEAEN